MTIYRTNARQRDLNHRPWTANFVPKGYWHDVENIGNEEQNLLLCITANVLKILVDISISWFHACTSFG